MQPSHRWMIGGALVVSLALGLLLEPPQPLADWVPEREWQVVGLSAAMFLAAITLMTILDVLPLRLTLFGSEVRARDDDASVLAPQVATLQRETLEIANMARHTVARVRYLSENVVTLERRVTALERGNPEDHGQ